MPGTPTQWYRFQKPSKKEWIVAVTAILTPLLLLGAWEVLGLPEEGVRYVLYGAVGIVLLYRVLRRGRQ